MSARTRLLLGATVSALALSIATADAALLWDSDAQGGDGYYTFLAAQAGDYTITAGGAQGGGRISGPSAAVPGGSGARATGTFHLDAGTTLRIVVGGVGGSAPLSGQGGAGGGGGSFVWYDVNNLLAVGGGGGGAGTGFFAPGGNATPGRLTNSVPGLINYRWGGGGGQGGSVVDGAAGAAGNGGAPYIQSTIFPGGQGGKRYGLAGLASGGGSGDPGAGGGGFGGGGGGGAGGYLGTGEYGYGYYGLGGGGGGGGWDGGLGGGGGYAAFGYDETYFAGGAGGIGGGSFLRSGVVNPSYALGGGSVEFLGDGRVLISFIGETTAIPEPASMGLFGLSLAGLALARRRRGK